VFNINNILAFRGVVLKIKLQSGMEVEVETDRYDIQLMLLDNSFIILISELKNKQL
jgi:hypothetical protein